MQATVGALTYTLTAPGVPGNRSDQWHLARR